MKRILPVAAFLIVLAIGVLALGYFSSRHFEGSTTVQLPYQRRDVWAVLVDTNRIPLRRPGVQSVELLPRDQGMRRWREVNDLGGSADFTVHSEIPGEFLAVWMTASTSGMSGTWTYALVDAGAATAVTITENSYIDNAVPRALATLWGRGKSLQDEVQSLRSAVGQSVP